MATRTGIPVEQQVATVTERLVHDYAGTVPDQVVRGLVDEAFSDYAEAPVQQFVPVLVDRTVRQQLRQTVFRDHGVVDALAP